MPPALSYQAFVYDPYGRGAPYPGTAPSIFPSFGFTGLYSHLPSGLSFATYRAYSAEVGRWINRDPIGERGGLNVYEYVGGSPLNYSDPLGLYVACLRLYFSAHFLCWHSNDDTGVPQDLLEFNIFRIPEAYCRFLCIYGDGEFEDGVRRGNACGAL